MSIVYRCQLAANPVSFDFVSTSGNFENNTNIVEVAREWVSASIVPYGAICDKKTKKTHLAFANKKFNLKTILEQTNAKHVLEVRNAYRKLVLIRSSFSSCGLCGAI